MTAAPADDRSQLRRATTSLERLHAVLIGFAITAGAKSVLEPWLGGATQPGGGPPLTQILLFGALLVTIIPFYHGANCHLDSTHFDSFGAFSRGEFLVDYFLLFTEGAIFAAIGLSVISVRHFVWTFLALIMVDSTWAALTWWLLARRHVSADHIRRWLILNLSTVLGLLIATRLWGRPIALDVDWFPFADAAAWWLCVAAVARTAVDYWLNRQWYFPLQTISATSMAD